MYAGFLFQVDNTGFRNIWWEISSALFEKLSEFIININITNMLLSNLSVKIWKLRKPGFQIFEKIQGQLTFFLIPIASNALIVHSKTSKLDQNHVNTELLRQKPSSFNIS